MSQAPPTTDHGQHPPSDPGLHPPSDPGLHPPSNHGEHGDHAAHGHKKHKGGHGGHGGGGHGGWLVTYCDMITLLIAFFICMLTFSSKNQGNFPRMRDSALYGLDGTGTTNNKIHGQDWDSVVWRECRLTSRFGLDGGDNVPNHSDPTRDLTAVVVKRLEKASDKTLAQNYGMQVPIELFFDRGQSLSSSGQAFLRGLGKNLRNLPYDLLIQVPEAKHVARGVSLARHLSDNEGIFPSRISVGVQGAPAQAAAAEAAADQENLVRFTFVRRLEGRGP